MGSLGIEEEVMMNWSSSDDNNNDDFINNSSGIIDSLSTSRLPLLALNHVSYVCKSVADSVKFYVDVLGFVLVKRPSSFKFEGAWLFNYGIGIHLLECNELERKKRKINPKDNHISFQCSDMKMVIKKLEAMKIEYVTALVEEGGIQVDQLFFHDPDGYMVEICNCHNIPILPLSSCPLPRASKEITQATTQVSHCSNGVEAQLMESLMMDMTTISF